MMMELNIHRKEEYMYKFSKREEEILRAIQKRARAAKDPAEEVYKKLTREEKWIRIKDYINHSLTDFESNLKVELSNCDSYTERRQKIERLIPEVLAQICSHEEWNEYFTLFYKHIGPIVYDVLDECGLEADEKKELMLDARYKTFFSLQKISGVIILKDGTEIGAEGEIKEKNPKQLEMSCRDYLKSLPYAFTRPENVTEAVLTRPFTSMTGRTDYTTQSGEEKMDVSILNPEPSIEMFDTFQRCIELLNNALGTEAKQKLTIQATELTECLDSKEDKDVKEKMLQELRVLIDLVIDGDKKAIEEDQEQEQEVSQPVEEIVKEYLLVKSNEGEFPELNEECESALGALSSQLETLRTEFYKSIDAVFPKN